MLYTADGPLISLFNQVGLKQFDALAEDTVQKLLPMLLFLIPSDDSWDVFSFFLASFIWFL